jgi:hypothetical protein
MSAAMFGIGIWGAVLWQWSAAILAVAVAVAQSWGAVQLLRGQSAKNHAWLLFAIMVCGTFILRVTR